MKSEFDGKYTNLSFSGKTASFCASLYYGLLFWGFGDMSSAEFESTLPFRMKLANEKAANINLQSQLKSLGEQLVFEANAQKQLEEWFTLFESQDSPRESQSVVLLTSKHHLGVGAHPLLTYIVHPCRFHQGHIAARAGGFLTIVVVGMAAIGVTILYATFYVLLGVDSPDAMKLGGEIFTKAAAVEANLLRKIEQGISEDDPQNPIVIANLEEATDIKNAGKAWYKIMVSDNDYTEFDTFSKWLGVLQ
ncbi:hypothetical protein GIB67_019820 [Kingdonia uniflora]|uniref:H(+)-exporting diphosphatase n=1 Tax=Kingdonia uniflora TaxID=39325 RepID=A0A7J7MKH0_9MAGN|nr:hypothetical protein GIB67_019820 [Kingdonia uniflora]